MLCSSRCQPVADAGQCQTVAQPLRACAVYEHRFVCTQSSISAEPTTAFGLSLHPALQSTCTHCHGEGILKIGGKTACQQQQTTTAAPNVASQHCSIRGSCMAQQQSDTIKTGSASHDSKKHR